MTISQRILFKLKNNYSKTVSGHVSIDKSLHDSAWKRSWIHFPILTFLLSICVFIILYSFPLDSEKCNESQIQRKEHIQLPCSSFLVAAYYRGSFHLLHERSRWERDFWLQQILIRSILFFFDGSSPQKKTKKSCFLCWNLPPLILYYHDFILISPQPQFISGKRVQNAGSKRRQSV